MKLILNIIFILSVISACKDESKPQETISPDELRETLIKTNQLLAKKEAEEIESYIKRNDLSMEQTGTGLRYKIKSPGSELRPDENDTLTIKYNINLLDGTSLIENEYREDKFIFGRAQMPAGLEEGLKMIGEGGEIFMIIPSHLAYGKRGDDKNIPGGTPLIVNAQLLKLNKNK